MRQSFDTSETKRAPIEGGRRNHTVRTVRTHLTPRRPCQTCEGGAQFSVAQVVPLHSV